MGKEKERGISAKEKVKIKEREEKSRRKWRKCVQNGNLNGRHEAGAEWRGRRRRTTALHCKWSAQWTAKR